MLRRRRSGKGLFAGAYTEMRAHTFCGEVFVRVWFGSASRQNQINPAANSRRFSLFCFCSCHYACQTAGALKYCADDRWENQDKRGQLQSKSRYHHSSVGMIFFHLATKIICDCQHNAFYTANLHCSDLM